MLLKTIPICIGYLRILQSSENTIQTEKISLNTADNVSETNRLSKQVVAAMKQITEIIGFITEIAFQTYILDLNTAVGAVRAGEHGKRFSVVAVEVRKLAVEDINNLVKEGLKVSMEAGKNPANWFRKSKKIPV